MVELRAKSLMDMPRTRNPRKRPSTNQALPCYVDPVTEPSFGMREHDLIGSQSVAPNRMQGTQC